MFLHGQTRKTLRRSFLGRTFSNQALKLVKQIIAVDSSRLPREVVRTVVAVSGHKEDNFRRVGPNGRRFGVLVGDNP